MTEKNADYLFHFHFVGGVRHDLWEQLYRLQPMQTV